MIGLMIRISILRYDLGIMNGLLNSTLGLRLSSATKANYFFQSKTLNACARALAFAYPLRQSKDSIGAAQSKCQF